MISPTTSHCCLKVWRQRTREGLVGANLLLGGSGEGSGLLVGGNGVLGSLAYTTHTHVSLEARLPYFAPAGESRTAHEGGAKGAGGDAGDENGAAGRGDGGALQEHCVADWRMGRSVGWMVLCGAVEGFARMASSGLTLEVGPSFGTELTNGLLGDFIT